MENNPESMVKEQLGKRDITDKRVLAAFRKVKRELFVPPSCKKNAYEDRPLPIGCGQTISQPYIVALTTQLLQLKGGEKILEIGSGCGYQSAILAEMGCTVYGLEIVKSLLTATRSRFQHFNYNRVYFYNRDGHHGLPEYAPYDCIAAGCAPAKIPSALFKQLKNGGRMVMPAGEHIQWLFLVTKSNNRIWQKKVTPVSFVSMRGG